jgi:hypothetical protein
MGRNVWRAKAAAVIALGVCAGTLTLGQGAAVADGDPVGDVTSTVKKKLEPVTGAVAPKAPKPRSGASTPSSPPGAPASQDETPPNEVADPTTPDHAGAEVLHSQVAGQDAADEGSSRATVEDDDSSSADASLLTVGGNEVMGSHADSTGPRHDQDSVASEATDPVCTGSADALCFDVMYSDANATESGSRSHSDASSGLFRFCVGGDGEQVDCGGAPAQGQVGQSSSQIDRNRATGRTTAASDSDAAAVCLTAPSAVPLPFAGCGVGVEALGSHGRSDSGGAQPSADRGSSVGSLTIAGQEQPLDQTAGAAVPPDCAPGTSLACGYVNQGETYLGQGSAGHAQEALKVVVLPAALVGVAATPQDLLFVIGGRSETLVHNDGGEPVTHTPGAPGTPGHHVKATGAARAPALVAGDAGSGARLPNTGGPAAGLLVGGLLATGAGAMLVSVSRMRRFGVSV